MSFVVSAHYEWHLTSQTHGTYKSLASLLCDAEATAYLLVPINFRQLPLKLYRKTNPVILQLACLVHVNKLLKQCYSDKTWALILLSKVMCREQTLTIIFCTIYRYVISSLPHVFPCVILWTPVQYMLLILKMKFSFNVLINKSIFIESKNVQNVKCD